ncbi:MAG TPA: GNAT family N-acetyltransferase [Candidatus Norongarragalinales archaeon]|nr:GNAT family N-acetyltransferase [Candidatus Norongarragalinales archaeon]
MAYKPQTSRKIVIKPLQANQYALAQKLEDLQIKSQVRRSGQPPTHPIWNKAALLMKANPRFGTGLVLVAFRKTGRSLSDPVGYYLADFDNSNNVVTSYVGVHPSARGEGIGTLLHDRMEKIAIKKGISGKKSTVSPHNIPSLVVNVNHQGFNVVSWAPHLYGPDEHRFFIEGKFGVAKRPPSTKVISNALRINLNKDEILSVLDRGAPFLLELTQDHGDSRELLLKYVDWTKFHGTHVHVEDDRPYLLLEPKRISVKRR